MSRALLFKIGAAALPAVLFLHGCQKESSTKKQTNRQIESSTHKASEKTVSTEEPPHEDLATIKLVADRYDEIHQVIQID